MATDLSRRARIDIAVAVLLVVGVSHVAASAVAMPGSALAIGSASDHECELPDDGLIFCTLECEPGQHVRVIVPGGFDPGVASCGGANAACVSDFAPCSATSVTPALVGAVGTCKGVNARCFALEIS